MQQQPELQEDDYAPPPANAWVYDVVEGDKVVYVGLSIDPDRRLKEHKKTGVASESAKVVRVSFHADWFSARDAEWERIQEILPPKNKMGVKLPNDKAFVIWTDKELSQKEKLKLMWGWSKNTAIYAFGRVE